MPIEINNDITIIGGGIAGLWLTNMLSNLNYNTILIEKDAFGSHQTINSQGIIHGGIKYSLLGRTSKTTYNISKMPIYWDKCLQNNFNEPFLLNLSQTSVNSLFHDLAFPKSITAKFKSLISANLLVSSGNIINANDENYQSSLNSFGFSGVVYRIKEKVLDVPSLINNLVLNIKDKCLHLNNYELKFKTNTQSIESILFTENSETFEIKSKLYIFTSGSNNKILLNKFENKYKQQIRPLHMLYALPDTNESIFGHFIDPKLFSNKPLVTITTHHNKTLNRNILYFGGSIAESSYIGIPKEDQIFNLKKTLKQIFPSINTNYWKWATQKIDRAELHDSDNLMPNTASLIDIKNYLIAWPTKLTFAPDLAQQVLNHINKINLKPSISNLFKNSFYKLKTPKSAEPCYESIY